MTKQKKEGINGLMGHLSILIGMKGMSCNFYVFIMEFWMNDEREVLMTLHFWVLGCIWRNELLHTTVWSKIMDVMHIVLCFYQALIDFFTV